MTSTPRKSRVACGHQQKNHENTVCAAEQLAGAEETPPQGRWDCLAENIHERRHRHAAHEIEECHKKNRATTAASGCRCPKKKVIAANVPQQAARTVMARTRTIFFPAGSIRLAIHSCGSTLLRFTTVAKSPTTTFECVKLFRKTGRIVAGLLNAMPPMKNTPWKEPMAKFHRVRACRRDCRLCEENGPLGDSMH